MKRKTQLGLAVWHITRPQFCASAIALCLACWASASGEPTDTGTNENRVELTEIVVTAQRVESNLQHTPVAVTNLSEGVLQDRNVATIEDLSGIAPSLQIGTRTGGGSSLGEVTIRGMGINASPPASPAVGLYIDEVYYPGAFGNLIGVFDVDNIQVLRGPQGTLFGRNTIGGALLYTSNPVELNKVAGFAELTGGNQGRADAEGGINLPLGDKVAVRLSGAVTNEAGYVHDELNAINHGSAHDRQARLQLRADPTDDFSVNIKVEDLEQRSNGPATIVTGFNYHSIFGAPFAPNGAAPFISTSQYEVAGFNAPTYFNARFRLVEMTTSYRLGEDVTFKSISAYSVSNSNENFDEDYTPLPIIASSLGLVRDELFTQELRLSGNSFKNRLHWGGGVYFYGEHNNNCCQTSDLFGNVSSPFGNYVISTQSYSAYGQATFDLTEQWAVVAGARYTDEEVGLSDSAAAPILAPYSAKASFHNTSPLVGLNYQANRDLLIYVKASEGFRAGSFSPTVAAPNLFNPETAKTYEAGARWEGLERRLRINPTLYYTVWDNIQFNGIGFCSCYPSPLPFVRNAGNAKVKGAELELQAAVTADLMLTGSLAFLDSHYDTIPPFLAQGDSLSSNTPLEHAPKTSFSIGPRYSLHLSGDAELIGALSYTWQSRQRSATTNDENVEIASYGLLNGRLTYQAPSNRWSVALWGKNLTNKEYFIGGTDFGGSGAIPTVTADVGRPREYGATLRYNF